MQFKHAESSDVIIWNMSPRCQTDLPPPTPPSTVGENRAQLSRSRLPRRRRFKPDQKLLVNEGFATCGVRHALKSSSYNPEKALPSRHLTSGCPYEFRANHIGISRRTWRFRSSRTRFGLSQGSSFPRTTQFRRCKGRLCPVCAKRKLKGKMTQLCSVVRSVAAVTVSGTVARCRR